MPSTPQDSWRRVEWTYDAKGRRIRQKTWQWTNSTWQVIEDLKFLCDPMSVGRHILELNASNNAVVLSYVWGLDLSGTLDGAGGVGGLLWVTMNSGPAAGTHFAAYDGNGNVVGLVSATTGTETARYEYGPFAEPIRVSDPAARPNLFRFSTKRTDDTTDLVLYEYRAYNPTLGRWLSRDPIGEKGGVNLYAFTRNTPQNRADLLGLKCCCTPGEMDLLKVEAKQVTFGQKPDAEKWVEILKEVGRLCEPAKQIADAAERAKKAFLGMVEMGSTTGVLFDFYLQITFRCCTKASQWGPPQQWGPDLITDEEGNHGYSGRTEATGLTNLAADFLRELNELVSGARAFCAEQIKEEKKK